MASSFPTSYDTLTNPTAGSLLTSPSHADQHINANDIVEALEQRAGLTGTGFPGGPSSGQRFYRTDRDIEYEYNGTRWLSVDVYTMPLGGSTTLSATGSFYGIVPFAGVYDLWLEDFQMGFIVVGGTALGASHKWVCVLQKQPAGSTVATVNIDSGASDVWRNSGQVAIDALVGTTNFAFQVACTKTGTPGNLTPTGMVYYRLVG